MRIQFIILTLCAISRVAYTQEPFFIQQEINEPFVNSQVNHIYQTTDGQVWFGSDRGLLTYDGFELSEVLPSDTSIAITDVVSMFEDTEKTLWIGTSSGQVYTYTAESSLRAKGFDEGWPKVSITGFAQDTHGQIWIATYGEGIYCYDGQYLYNFNTDDGLLGNDVYAIVSDGLGRVWLGTDGGINICAFINKEKHIGSKTVADGLPDQIIKYLKTDAKSNIWVGTHESGICYIDVSADTIGRYVDHVDLGTVVCLEVFDEDELWIGTETNGLWRYQVNKDQLQKLQNQPDLRSTRILSLLIDVESNLWCATGANEVYLAHRPFETLRLPTHDVQALYSDAYDRLWIGTNSGLFLYDQASDSAHTFIRLIPELMMNVTGIVADHHGYIWIGTIDRGIYIFDEKTDRLRHLHVQNGLMNNAIMSLATLDNDLWIATLGGGAHYDLSEDIFDDYRLGRGVTHLEQLSSHFLYQVFIDHDGNPWFASDGDGVFVVKDGVAQQHNGSQDVILKTVYSITEDHQGHIWMSTPRNGLVEFDGSVYRRLDGSAGLRNLNISGLATDAQGDIHIVHYNGVDLLKPNKRHFMYFDDEIGVKKLDPGLNASCIDQYGAIWFGATTTIIKYHAPRKAPSIHPQTQITRVSVFLDPIDSHTKTVFPHRENYISFDYVGLWYTSPNSVKYLYTLEGYDLDWKESRDQFASYSSLPPGEYTFKVKASENTFFHDEPIASYQFRIKKPVWQQIWFLTLLILALSGLMYMVMRFREKRSERQALLKKEKIESQFLALKAQINPHFLFNSFNTLITIIEENPDIAVEYVENLADFYRSILQYREQETISIQEEINLVESYCFLLEKRYGKNFNLNIQINGSQSSIPPLTLQMLVENAVKHNIISKSKPLTVDISIDSNEYLTVKNNKQKKLTAVSSTHFGLQSIINRYQLLSDKKVQIEDSSTHFKVSVPLIKTKSHANSHH